MVAPPLIPKRFRLLDELGSGAFGVVYRVQDLEHGDILALKTLQNINPNALLRFKNEFRALAALRHPHLVSLYELFAENEAWCFTMELVEGVDVLNYVRSVSRELSTQDTVDTLGMTLDAGALPQHTSTQPRLELPTGTLKPARLRSVLVQLIDALRALHEHGKLHRDIKPSNVLVSQEGRVVVLDFGLVLDITEEAETVVAGTPAYMAPEQIRGEPVGTAADFYALGVLLFEALTGRLPFEDLNLHALLHRKTHELPPDPRTLDPHLPEDLSQLCLELLSPDPSQRPGASTLLEQLGADPSNSSHSALPALSPRVVGRHTETRALLSTFERMLQDAFPALVFLQGESGIGKSTLVGHALEQIVAQAPHAIVLRGRCHERESVPFKAIDRLIDGLTTWLVRHPNAITWPEGSHELTRLFPVLGQVAPSTSTGAEAAGVELRTRAYGALRELFCALSRQHPVVLAIDDLQWGDEDSARLLIEILRPPLSPRLMLLATYRPESGSRLMLDELLQSALLPASWSEVIPLERMRSDDLAALAETLVPEASPQLVRRWVREAEGRPFFLEQLVHLPESEAHTSLEQVLSQRWTALTQQSRALLEVVAVCGYPVPTELGLEVAGIAGSQSAVLHELQTARMIVTSEHRGAHALLTYHDRIRETLTHSLESTRTAAIHKAMALAIESRGRAHQVDALLFHYRALGRSDKIAPLAREAAQRAMGSAAFVRATELLELALEHTPQPTPSQRIELADALSASGRCDEAASHFLEAAEHPPPEQRIHLRLQAVEQLATAGLTERGSALLDSVRQDVGLAPAKAVSIPRVLLRRARVKLGGMRFQERETLADEDRDRLRVAMVSAGFHGSNDPVLSYHLHNEHLRLALRVGDRRCMAHALIHELAFAASGGPRAQPRMDGLLSTIEPLVEDLDELELYTLFHTHLGTMHHFMGRWRASLNALMQYDGLFGGHNPRPFYWQVTPRVLLLSNLVKMGRAHELEERMQTLKQFAIEHDNAYVRVLLTGYGTVTALIRDAPDEALEKLEDYRATFAQFRSSSRATSIWYDVRLANHVHFYRGDGDSAFSTLEQHWKILERQFRLHHYMRTESWFLRGRGALYARDTRRGGRVLHKARKLLSSLPGTWSQAHGTLLGALAAHREGDDERASELLEAAEKAYRQLDMEQLAETCRLRRAQAQNNPEAQSHAREALRQLGYSSPDRISDVWAPWIRAL